MPDRDYEKRDELLDRGWDKMSAILDKEMPQRRSRRRLLFWIPLGLIGALAMTFSVWYSTGPGVEANGVPPALEKAMPEEGLHRQVPAEVSGDQQQVTTMIADEPETRTELAIAEATVAMSSPDILSSEQPTPDNETRSMEHDEGSLRSQYEVDNELIINSKIGHVESEELSQQGNAAPENLEPNIERPLTIARTDIGPLADLRPISTSLLYDVSPGQIDVIAPADPKFKGSFGLGAYVSSHWNAPITLQGVEAGLLAAWKASRRLTITGGVAFGHHRKLGIANLTSSKRDDAEAAIMPDPDTTTIGNISYDLNTVGYDTVEALVNKLNYLHLPLYIEYQATRNLSVRVGARASYMLGAPVSDQGQNFALNSAFTGTILLDADSSPRLLLKEGVVRKWDVAPMIGVGWDISRLLAIDINYQHGLIPYVDRDAFNRSDYNRTLSVGLRVKML